MKTIAELIDSLGGVTAVADYLSTYLKRRVSVGTVSSWKTRNTSVPDEYRPALVQMASDREVGGVDYQSLTMMFAKPQAPAGVPA